MALCVLWRVGLYDDRPFWGGEFTGLRIDDAGGLRFLTVEPLAGDTAGVTSKLEVVEGALLANGVRKIGA